MSVRRHLVHLSLGTAIAALALTAPPARAQWSGSLTEPWWSLPGGGASATTGGAYRLSAAAGSPTVAALSGGIYRVTGGFWSETGGGAPTATPVSGPPARFAFAPPTPNPFTSATDVAFDLPVRDHVRAEVFDVRGERVRTLVDESREAGRYREHWDGRDATGHLLGAGVYFVRVRATGNDVTRRVVRLD
jgi:FlgD Ig-like domain